MLLSCQHIPGMCRLISSDLVNVAPLPIIGVWMKRKAMHDHANTQI
jgi:hypothetical protein